MIEIKINERQQIEFKHPIKNGVIKTQVFTQSGLSELLKIAEENWGRIEGNTDYPDMNTNDRADKQAYIPSPILKAKHFF